jgi:hypothetical protein
MQSSLLKMTFPKNYLVYNDESIIDMVKYFLSQQSVLRISNEDNIKIIKKKNKYTVFQINFDPKNVKFLMSSIKSTFPLCEFELKNSGIYYLGPKNPILTLEVF